MKIRHVSFGISTNLPSKFGILFVTASVNKIRSAVIGGMDAKKSVQEPGVPLDRLISFATRRERYFTFFSSPLLTSTHLVGMIFSFVGRSIISHTCIWFITLISSDRASSTFSVESGFPEILSQYWGASASTPRLSSHTGRTVVVSVCTQLISTSLCATCFLRNFWNQSRIVGRIFCSTFDSGSTGTNWRSDFGCFNPLLLFWLGFEVFFLLSCYLNSLPAILCLLQPLHNSCTTIFIMRNTLSI